MELEGSFYHYKENFYSYVQIIEDKQHPELEGKIMVMKYGFQIKQKIDEQLNPQIDDEEPTQIFDLFEGKDFYFIAKKVDGYANFLSSKFANKITIEGSNRALAATADGELTAVPQYTGAPEQLWRIEQLIDGTYDPSGMLFKEIHDSIVYGVEGQPADVFFLLADFDSYCQAREKIATAYADKKAWARMTLKNIANSGKFSSDRTIEDYVRDIWKIEKVVIK